MFEKWLINGSSLAGSNDVTSCSLSRAEEDGTLLEVGEARPIRTTEDPEEEKGVASYALL